MPEGWEWDATLFKGSAAYYTRGRLPYPPALVTTFAGAAELGGNPRLLDVGCGPGTVTILLAPLFTEAVGVAAAADMIEEAARLAAEGNFSNVRWVHARAE